MIVVDIAEQVYETLLNTLEPEYCVPWVKPVFIPGNPCYEAYCDMHSAYEQVRMRLGATEEDVDAEKMIDKLIEHGKLLAMEMFRYGMLYQKMQKEISGGQQN